MIVGTGDNQRYWNEFYKSNANLFPSQFCSLFLTEINQDVPIVEFGCGNGRDALFLASRNHEVFAMDISQEAIARCEHEATSMGLKNISFFQGNISSCIDTKIMVEMARSKYKEIAFYSRFVMHSIAENEELEFFKILSKVLNIGERIYFEFRSVEDASLNKIYGGHYRRFIDTRLFVKNLKENFGFSVKYSITGQGMAKYKNEDPFVSRVIIEKNV